MLLAARLRALCRVLLVTLSPAQLCHPAPSHQRPLPPRVPSPALTTRTAAYVSPCLPLCPLRVRLAMILLCALLCAWCLEVRGTSCAPLCDVVRASLCSHERLSVVTSALCFSFLCAPARPLFCAIASPRCPSEGTSLPLAALSCAFSEFNVFLCVCALLCSLHLVWCALLALVHLSVHHVAPCAQRVFTCAHRGHLVRFTCSPWSRVHLSVPQLRLAVRPPHSHVASRVPLHHLSSHSPSNTALSPR